METKKRRVEPPRCGFYMEKKRRHCRMIRRPDHHYCLEHMALDDRVPCPRDPKHSVRQGELDRHLAKCAVGRDPEVPWFQRDCNVDEVAATAATTAAAAAIDLLRAYHAEPLASRAHHNRALDAYIDHDQTRKRKHAAQHSALVGSLDAAGLLSAARTYLEFGCGKAELLRSINLAVLAQAPRAPRAFGLVDRGVNRMRMDSKIAKDCVAAGAAPPPVVRTRIDIKDLDLACFARQFAPPVVVVSKHLCGAATDLTLKCLLNSGLTLGAFDGLLVAMCCRHACLYQHLMPQLRRYLAEHGFDSPAAFEALTKAASWCNTARPEGMGDHEGTEHPSGLAVLDREQLGLRARRLIDDSRVHAVRLALPAYRVQTFLYIDASVTTENVCLRITKTDELN